MFKLFIILYLVHIIKNKQWMAIISVGVFIIGAVIIGVGQSINVFVVDILGLLTVVASLGLFIFSIIKEAIDD